MNPEEIKELLVKKIGLEDLSTEEQDDLISDTMSALMQRVITSVMVELSEEDQETLIEKLEDDMVADDEIESFLKGAFPDYEKFVEKETVTFFDDLEAFQKEEMERLEEMDQ